MELDDKSLHILSCDISIRQRNAAGIEDLLPFVCTAKTVGDSVTVLFDETGRVAVQSFVDAERLCCTGLSWELLPIGNQLQLTVKGTTEQVSIISGWFEQG